MIREHLEREIQILNKLMIKYKYSSHRGINK